MSSKVAGPGGSIGNIALSTKSCQTRSESLLAGITISTPSRTAACSRRTKNVDTSVDAADTSVRATFCGSRLAFAATWAHEAGDGGAHLIPACELRTELFPSGGGELIVLGALVVLRVPPFGLDPTLLFEAVQRGVE